MGRKKSGKRRKAVFPANAAPASAPPPPAGVDDHLEEFAREHEEHRATKRLTIAVELHLASESHFFTGLSGDISEGGLFVSTYRALEPGSVVDIEFSLPGVDRVVHARGQVRWHRDASPDAPPGVGVAFEELSDEDRRLIRRFCNLRPPLYYDDVG